MPTAIRARAYAGGQRGTNGRARLHGRTHVTPLAVWRGRGETEEVV
jgi:hypothetical protein